MVITLDKNKQPLGVCSERRARILLQKKRAYVRKYFPFTIVVKDTDIRTLEKRDEYRIKIDPGSKYTGIAVVRLTDDAVVFFQQIEHRGGQVKSDLETRSATRRNRRSRETRYRRPKWRNKQLAKNKKPGYDTSRPEGWLPPSEKSIADNIISWVIRLKKLFNITQCSFEAVRIDTQLMDNPEIEGVEYQHGELAGWECREYLLDKYGHTCQYCRGASGDKILEVEHINPKAQGGSNKIKNLTIACHTCNQAKGARTPKQWLVSFEGNETKLAEERCKGIRNVIRNKVSGVSNRYCAWVNSTRRYIEKALFFLFGDVECASGGRTKANRVKLKLPKDHHYDALCVGAIPENGFKDLSNGYCFMAKAIGRGSRLRGNINKCGIIILKFKKGPKRRFGFQNGDIVRANVPKGKYSGVHVGRVMTRASGSFDIRKANGERASSNYRYCRILQHDNGFLCSYHNRKAKTQFLSAINNRDPLR